MRHHYSAVATGTLFPAAWAGRCRPVFSLSLFDICFVDIKFKCFRTYLLEKIWFDENGTFTFPERGQEEIVFGWKGQFEL